MILGFAPVDLIVFVAISLGVCVTVCTLAMEASVLFVPAFVFLFPHITREFPHLALNEAIGLAITVEFFGYTSSVTGYALRRQIDLRIAGKLLAFTVPFAVAGRLASYVVPSGGLFIVFGLLLLGLAAVLYRAYRNGPLHTCLLCGDSIAMRRAEKEPVERGASTGFRLGRLDRPVAGSAGAFAGLVGIAVGEISNTLLTVRGADRVVPQSSGERADAAAHVAGRLSDDRAVRSGPGALAVEALPSAVPGAHSRGAGLGTFSGRAAFRKEAPATVAWRYPRPRDRDPERRIRYAERLPWTAAEALAVGMHLGRTRPHPCVRRESRPPVSARAPAPRAPPRGCGVREEQYRTRAGRR